MGTTAEKLTYLDTTKTKIRTGLNDLGAELTENDTFRSYANVLADIYDELPKVTDEGTDLELSNTKKGKLAITPKGSSSQFNTNGYQLFDAKKIANDEIIVSDNGKTISLPIAESGDGSVSTNKTLGELCPNLKVGDVAYVRFTRNLSQSYNTKIGLGSNKATWNTISGLTITQQWLNSEVWLYGNKYNSGETAQCILTDFRIVTNSDYMWEPYTDGPAPNTRYSYPVKPVTGENSLDIRNKNLFNDWEEGQINTTTGEPYDYSGRYRSKDYIEIQQNTNYFFSNTQLVSSAAYWFIIYKYDQNKNYLGFQHLKENDGYVYQGAININDGETKYIKFTEIAPLTSFTNTQLELGTSKTTYTPHEEQNYQLSLSDIELNSSPDETVRDEIRGTLDNWVRREYIGKVVLNGSENWDYTNGVFNLSTTTRYLLTNWLCNALTFGGTATNTSTAYQKGNNKISVNTSGSRLYIRIDDITSVSDFKTYLSSNNIIVNAPLAEYTDIPITDTTLINQLNDIYNNAHSYNGTTNITTTYEDGNEQMVIDASALKSWEVI